MIGWNSKQCQLVEISRKGELNKLQCISGQSYPIRQLIITGPPGWAPEDRESDKTGNYLSSIWINHFTKLKTGNRLHYKGGRYWQVLLYFAFVECCQNHVWIYGRGLRKSIIPAWIRNYIHHKMWDKNTYSFPNFNDGNVQVWEWISNFISNYTGHMIAYMLNGHVIAFVLAQVNKTWLILSRKF